MRYMKTCLVCEAAFTTNNKRNRYCSNQCLNKRDRSHSQETKDLLSKKRKDYLKNNPDKHVWKRHDKFKSIPCEKLKELLTSKDISYIEEWSPLENRNYSIDIAFPHIKFGIEVNGNQHYNRDGSLTDYYQKRHDEICAAGWTLIELHYSSCFNLDKILDLLDNKVQPDYSEYFKIKEIRKNKLKRRTREEASLDKKKQYDEKWEPYKQLILESKIDFSKFGWVGKVSKILGIKPQKINNWMKRYMLDFYESNCFKRKQIL